MSKLYTSSPKLKLALSLQNGARFYRCALQINPFAYLLRHNKSSIFSTESEYNSAIINSCKDLNIEVIGVTDHYRFHESEALVKAARDAGIFAFGGFEAVTKDGVHFLCLFDPDKDSVLERFIGECGIHDPNDLSPIGSKDSLELMECAKKWGSICIAAHVASDQGGLLKKLSGQTRINVWKSPFLLACALAGSLEQAPENLKSILKNQDSNYQREFPIAIINAQDVNSPEDLIKPGSSCLIKMSNNSVEGLRQAFLDPESRVRLLSDEEPDPHAEFLAMTWEGGFLSDTTVHFNENLNVFIGGRGAGKSTMIESLRYALGLAPIGDDVKKIHEGIIHDVLRSGTKVSLVVRSHHPSVRCYTIERTVPNPPLVKDENGNVLQLSPKDVLRGVEVFGQHEISELTKSRDKLTLLLDRFIEQDPTLLKSKSELRLQLEKNRGRIIEMQRDIKAIDDRLATLPAIEETLKRFQDAGLEDKLKNKSLLVTEEQIFVTALERIVPIKDLHSKLIKCLPIDGEFVAPTALTGLPNIDNLSEVAVSIKRFNDQLLVTSKKIEQIIKEVEEELTNSRKNWDERRNRVEENYQSILRELQKSKIDGEEFIQLRKQIEELRPLREKKELLQRELTTYETQRRNSLSEWEDIKATEFRKIEKAAKTVSKKLKHKVRVEVTMAGNREPLESLLREEVAGNLNAALERLRERSQISLPDFANCCREGRDSLMQNYHLPTGAADRIAQANLNFFMRIEELDLTPTTKIELNVAADGDSPVWRSLEELSTGQKATAVLLLLLLESDAPLVVDQPEDDLDNRFITDGVVPIMRQEKRRRQFVFSTHNANIPVLGDAELIVGLTAHGDVNQGQAKIAQEHLGSIDMHSVRELVEEILEGGKSAFEMRRLKYGF